MVNIINIVRVGYFYIKFLVHFMLTEWESKLLQCNYQIDMTLANHH